MALPTFEPVETLTLQERVYRELKRLLMTGYFAPGDALTIRSLAESMGTSVMPVREALQRLSADQAITFQANKSIRVPVLNRSDLLEIREIRVRLEGLAAERAAENFSDQEFEELEVYEAANIRALAEDDSSALFESNRKFHFLIYQAAKSAYLVPMIEGLWLKMGPMYYVRTTEWAEFRKVLVPAREHHVAIVAALKQRDPVAAGVAMREDVGAAIDVFLNHARLPSAEDASE